MKSVGVTLQKTAKITFLRHPAKLSNILGLIYKSAKENFVTELPKHL